jgi:hypothetical protein
MGLSKENLALVRATVKEAGDHLQGKLPPCPWLKQRNPYAHLYERLKSRLGKSYKDCDDSQVSQILKMIEWYRNNPC